MLKEARKSITCKGFRVTDAREVSSPRRTLSTPSLLPLPPPRPRRDRPGDWGCFSFAERPALWLSGHIQDIEHLLPRLWVATRTSKLANPQKKFTYER